MSLTCLCVFWHHLNYLDVQHGKDFEAIQNNIAMKYKKRGKPANMVKNKEQVRHFYYRTWHKISKHIDFANGKLPVILVNQKKGGTSLSLSEDGGQNSIYSLVIYLYFFLQ